MPGFTQILEDALLGAQGVSAYLGGPVARSSLIRTGLSEGLSATSILSQMRANGLGMRTQNFYQLVSQLTEGGGGGEWTWGGPGTTIDPRDIRLLEGGQEGKYMVNVRQYYTNVSPDGDIESGYRVSAILQDDLDIDQAVQSAQDILGNKYPGQEGGVNMITGWDVSSVVQWQGR